MSATSTIILSAPASKKNGHVEFTTSFKPPQNVSGRSCYLKVTNCTSTSADDAPLQMFKTYFVTMDLLQPYSYASINNKVDQSTITDKRLVTSGAPNKVVYCFSTGGTTVVDGVGVYHDSNLCSGSAPRILVEIPDGPQYITVGLYLANGEITNDYSNLTVMFELTPVDSGEQLDLSI